MKALFTVKPKDRNDLPCSIEFEKHVFDVKKAMQKTLGKKPEYTIETSFDQASVLYPKRFMFDYMSNDAMGHGPKNVVDAFFDAVAGTGVCLSKYDVHITIEWI